MVEPATNALLPPVRLMQLATGSWASAALSAAASLGVADQLAAGPRSVEELATALAADPPSLYRLLRACADLDLFEERDDREFALAPTGEALLSDAPGSMRSFAMWVGEPADRCTWANLMASIRTGSPAFDQLHDAPIWDYMRDRPEVADVFDRAMVEISAQIVPGVVESYDFSSYSRVVDVGGGRGLLLAGVLAANPHCRGVLYEQPDVIASADGWLQEAGVGDRCELVSGDFFESVPEGGDIYLLSHVIHNWDDAHAERLLANCCRAMRPDGRVLLVEALMPSKVEFAPLVKLMDLNMLLLCGGRQRTEAELAELLERVGLELAQVVTAGGSSVVEAVRTTTEPKEREPDGSHLT